MLQCVPGQPIQCGILIYTATAGNQGTLGGLVEVTRRFVQILRSALERERLCSGDPVCADHDPAAADDEQRATAVSWSRKPAVKQGTSFWIGR